ncbi:MAG: FUSC family protein [Trebonia sp.]
MRSVREGRLLVPEWIGGVVPEWLAEVVRPKKAPVPWGTMARAVFAVWVPLAVAFATGRRELALLPALGALLSISIDNGGPYWDRVRRIGGAAVFGGAPGLLIGTMIHGRGWIAVTVVVFVAGVSAVLARLGGVGSVTGLQLFVYSTLGLGPLGELRPYWHTALQWGVGVVWAVLLITPGFLLAPRSAERKAVAAVYHAIAADLRAIGTPRSADTHQALATALNEAYDAMLTGRASANGRSRRDMQLMAVLNVSHTLVEATSALRATGEQAPPWVTDTVDRLANAVLGEHGPGAGMLGTGGSGRRGRRRPPGTEALPMVPPEWSPSPGALALREGLVTLERVISGNWSPPAAPPAGTGSPGLLKRLRGQLRGGLLQLGELLAGGRIAWEYTLRLMLCTGVAAVLSEVLPLQRSYWLVLTVGIILKPDYGSVFARALQRAIGTVVGAVVGAAILAIVPYGPWLLVPFGVFAALLPFARARNFGLVATFLTPLVVLLIDLLQPSGWRLAEDRLIDTVLASAVVLVVGYAPWPSAWQAHLPGQFAEAVRAVCAYMNEALVPPPDDQAAQVPAGAPPGTAAWASGRAPAGLPAWPSLLRRRAFRALSNVRTEFQRTMAEPSAVRRRASAWWPALVGLEEVMDAVTATAVALGRGASPPSPASVHQLSGALRAVADAIETGTRPRPAGPLPADPQLEPVTDAVRSVLSMLTPGGGDAARGEPAVLAPA